MLVRALIPLTLSTCLLVFGPSAKGDLDIEAPAVPEVETPSPARAAAAPAPTPAPQPELAHALLASRLEALDRDIPGLALR